MATTDFSILNNAIQVTIGTSKKLYFTSPTTVQPNGDSTKLNIIFSNPRPALPTVYELLLTDLRVSGSGSAPADMAAALTALSSIFPKGNSSSAGTGVARDVPVIITLGESGASGAALNSDATTNEKSVRPQVQIFNPATVGFEDLQIGVNNNLGDISGAINPTTMHGIELGLANRMALGNALSYPTLYMIKAGIGGSRISQWNTGGIDWTTMSSRIKIALTQLRAKGFNPLIYVYYSQGINDVNTGYSATTWKSQTISHLAKIRQLVGYVPIIMTKFMTANDGYNATINDIVKADGYAYAVTFKGLTYTQPDGLHLDYASSKVMADKVIDVINTIFGDMVKYKERQEYAVYVKSTPLTLWEEVPLTFAAFTQSPTGTWNAASPTFGTSGLKISSGVDGYFRASYTASACKGFLIALDLTTTAEDYPTINYLLLINANNTYGVFESNVATVGLDYAEIGDLFQLRTSNISSVLTVYAEVSHDNGFTWTILKTFTPRTYVDLYLKANATASSIILVNPVGLNAV